MYNKHYRNSAPGQEMTTKQQNEFLTKKMPTATKQQNSSRTKNAYSYQIAKYLPDKKCVQLPNSKITPGQEMPRATKQRNSSRTGYDYNYQTANYLPDRK